MQKESKIPKDRFAWPRALGANQPPSHTHSHTHHTHTHTLGNTHTRAGVCSPRHSPTQTHSHPFGNKMAAKEAASTIPKKKRNSLTPKVR